MLILGHILGDFYFQTEKMAVRKSNSFSEVLIHGLYYWGAVMVAMMFVLSWQTIIFGTIAALAHFMIDMAKYLYISKQKKKMTPDEDQLIFMTDQILHLVCMIAAAYLFAAKNGSFRVCNVATQFLSVTGLSGTSLLFWVVALLIIHKPSNIAIAKTLAVYRPCTKISDRRHDKNAGRSIGTIERIIMLILISIHQYSAIGLVLTAKSIARYDKIAKEPEFAEYYLMGTLLSTAVVIITSFILM